MYAPMVKTGADRVKPVVEMDEAERAFQQRIDAGIKIEPGTGCPRAIARP